MTVALDHVMVLARNKEQDARRLAEVLGVPWGPAGAGPFTAVYVNEGLTLDFDQHEGTPPHQHFCFRVTDEEFDAIFARLKASGLPYRSSVAGPVDMKAGTHHGGRLVYWSDPPQIHWELLTVSYARRPV